VEGKATRSHADVAAIVPSFDGPPLCAVCMDSPEEIYLRPCKHRLCESCGARVRFCPFCRAEICGQLQGLLSLAASRFAERPGHVIRRAPPGALDQLPTAVRQRLFERIARASKHALHGQTLTVLLSGADCARLDLSYNQLVRDADLASAFPDLGRLRVFDGSFATQLSDEGVVAVLKGAPALEQLLLCGLENFTSEAFVADSGKLPSLRVLDLGECSGLRQSLLGHVGTRCRALRRLSLRDCRHLTDDALALLRPSCGELRVLDLSGCEGLSADGVVGFVGGCSGLEGLHVARCGRCDGPRLLAGLAQGEALNCTLSECDLGFVPRLDDESLCPFLERCGAELRRLILRKAERMTDKTLEAIKRHCPHAHELDIAWTSVTDFAVMRLAREARELAHFNVANCTDVSKATQYMLHRMLELRQDEEAAEDQRREQTWMQARAQTQLQVRMSQQRCQRSLLQDASFNSDQPQSQPTASAWPPGTAAPEGAPPRAPAFQSGLGRCGPAERARLASRARARRARGTHVQTNAETLLAPWATASGLA